MEMTMKSMKYFVVAAALLAAVGCKPKAGDPTSEGDSASAQPMEQAAESDQGGESAGDTAAAEAEEPAGVADEAPGRGETSEGAASEAGAESAEDILAQFEGEGTLTATIVTTNGTLHCELFEEMAPSTVANFAGLATGKKTYRSNDSDELVRGNFYNGLIFHRVIPGFMIQGGDPTGTGTSGPGYQFEDEFVDSLVHDKPATMSMANSGPNTNGSQFFITDGPTPHLDGRHSVFGHCDEADVVAEIARVTRGRGDRPVDDVIIESVTVARVSE